MYKRLYSFLEENNSFYPYQFGFRSNHSTNNAFIGITEQIRKPCNKGPFASGIFLELQKAFHAVNHNILLTKLEHCGIKSNASYWLHSFLTDWKQYTSVTGLKLPRNYSWISPRVCTRSPSIYHIYQWFISVSNIK